MNNTQINVLGYSVFACPLTTILPLDRKLIVNTLNQYSYCIAEKDDNFKKALMHSDILLPDGVGITLASKILKGQELTKIAGADLHKFLLNHLNKTHGKCFYMGASISTLKKIEERISLEYPNITVATYSPPYKMTFTSEDSKSMIAAINAFSPQVLFVGMTAPKQEKWIYEHKDSLNVNGPIGAIGAVFDFYAGTVKRPGSIWRTLGLEWLGRLCKEPKRMWKRYIYHGFEFGLYLIKAIPKRNI